MVIEPLSIDATPLAQTSHDRALLDVFGNQIYAIGGRVRDHFIAQHHGRVSPPKDLDYVVIGLDADAVTRALERVGTINPVGKSFGIIKLTRPDGQILDVALARREISTGAGHRDFAVDFGSEVTIIEDALRRDFSINALSVRLSDGAVFGPPDALDDLRNGIIRMNAPTAFRDDPLRILRAVQFASRLDFAIDRDTQIAMQHESHRLQTVSPERTAEELSKLLERSRVPSLGVNLLAHFDLLPYTLPELAEGRSLVQNAYHSLDVFEHNVAALDVAARSGGDLTDRLAALLHDVGKPRSAQPRPDGQGNSFHGHEDIGAAIVRERLTALRFPGDLIDDVAHLTANHMYVTLASDGSRLTDATVRRFIARVARGSDDPETVRLRVDRQFALRHADRMAGSRVDRSQANATFEARVINELERVPALTVRALALNGHDVIQRAVEGGVLAAPGRNSKASKGFLFVGAVLKGLLEDVINEPALNTREALAPRIDEHLDRFVRERRSIPVDRLGFDASFRLIDEQAVQHLRGLNYPLHDIHRYDDSWTHVRGSVAAANDHHAAVITGDGGYRVLEQRTLPEPLRHYDHVDLERTGTRVIATIQHAHARDQERAR